MLTAGIPGVVPVGSTQGVIDTAFQKGNVSGNSGCNSYGGRYTVSDNSLRFGPLLSTQMGCVDNAIMRREQQYLAALAKVESYSLQGQTLTLTGTGVKLTYTQQAAPANLPLDGTHWKLTTFYSGATASTPAAGIVIDATLGTDGIVKGNDGCQSFHATFTTGIGGTMKIGPLTTTTGEVCTRSVTRWARSFTFGLSSTAAFLIQASALTLLDASGHPLLGFEGKSAG